MNSPNPPLFDQQIIEIARCDRWLLCQRLADLAIPCGFLDDGNVWVTVENFSTALQLRSVVQQLTASRLELIARLEQCWKLGG